MLKTGQIEKKTQKFWKSHKIQKSKQFRKCKSKIRQYRRKKLGPFFSLFLMRKPLSSGQKWFLRPYFPLIRVCVGKAQ